MSYSAYHEAGHAVVAHICGFPLGNISVLVKECTQAEYEILPKPPEDTKWVRVGGVDFDYNFALFDGQTEYSLRLFHMTVMAGPLAQMEISPGGQIPREDASLDFRVIVISAKEFFKGEVPVSWWKQIKADTERLLEKPPVWVL
jgi:hypothetical protein